MRESEFQRKVIRYWTGIAGKVYNIHGHGYQEQGIPDLYICHQEWTGWLELKAEHTAVSAIQRYQIKELCKRKVPAWFVRWTPEKIIHFTSANEILGYGFPTLEKNIVVTLSLFG